MNNKSIKTLDEKLCETRYCGWRKPDEWIFLYRNGELAAIPKEGFPHLVISGHKYVTSICLGNFYEVGLANLERRMCDMGAKCYICSRIRLDRRPGMTSLIVDLVSDPLAAKCLASSPCRVCSALQERTSAFKEKPFSLTQLPQNLNWV